MNCKESPDGRCEFAIGYYNEVECIYCGKLLRDRELCAMLNAAERFSAEDANDAVYLINKAGGMDAYNSIQRLYTYSKWRGQ